MNLLYNKTTKAALAFALIGATGCSKDFLDTRLDTQPVQHNVDQNYTTIIQLANAPYAYMQQINEFNVLDGNLFAAVTDEAVQTNSVGNVYLFNNGNWNQFNNPDDRYNNYYSGIFAVNYFLEYLNKNGGDYKALLALNRDTITADTRLNFENDIKLMEWSIPEAHVLRAYFYFELIKRYGSAPLLTQTYAISERPSVAASSFEDVVNFIITEIDTYKNDLQPNWKTSAFSNYDGRFTVGAALALKARVLLYAASPLHNPSNSAAKWEAAAAAANEALVFARRTDNTGGNNQLDADYRNYFLGSNTLMSNETILAIRYAPDNNLERANYPIATAGGNSGITPTHNLVSAYEFTGPEVPGNPYANRDPRLGYTIVTNGSTWNSRIINQAPGGSDDMKRINASRTGYYLKKFLVDNADLINNAQFQHNWPVFRFGELLLVYAEAMNEAYGPDNNNGYVFTAREAINMVRSRPGVNMPAVTAAAQGDFREAVKHERRIELAFENHRYWDLIRWGNAADIQNQPVTGVEVTRHESVFIYTPKAVQNRVFVSPKMNFYPFPQSEINISNGAIVQNPGW
ncbi:RagB/SusD family nutrient uptake outer membrane protein [Gynurincola endophyticus]|uniref:RagB/SusD family nutrient uptake outer membrane protein n=1 Tax=Gynurincola endophyticus TaxID=2479004 RepID=UPI000F8E39BA|nr:RagB/SusD family nutrient uptake outer membrane protein [Gynurincola endophyticus]